MEARRRRWDDLRSGRWIRCRRAGEDTLLHAFIGEQGAFFSRSSAVTFYHILLPFLILTDSLDYLNILFMIRNKNKVFSAKNISVNHDNISHERRVNLFQLRHIILILPVVYDSIHQIEKKKASTSKNSTSNAQCYYPSVELSESISNNYHDRHRSHQI